MTDTYQLKHWSAEFGKAYTDRNVVDWREKLPIFQSILRELKLDRILEVGCNRGHNMIALSRLFENAEIVGVEPNTYALELAEKSFLELRPNAKITLNQGNVFQLPFEDGYFDLVFTSGVLIHVPLQDLLSATDEIYRVSDRYILAIEYYADEETEIHYRGHDNLLWKRDFLKHYLDNYPDLKLLRSGNIAAQRSTWWLLEKSKHRKI